MRAVEKRLRERIKELELELSDVKQDRQKLRDAFVSNLKSAIQIHGEGKYWNMNSMIEKFAKQLHGFTWWYW